MKETHTPAQRQFLRILSLTKNTLIILSYLLGVLGATHYDVFLHALIQLCTVMESIVSVFIALKSRGQHYTANKHGKQSS